MSVSPLSSIQDAPTAAPLRAYWVQWLVLVTALLMLGAQIAYDQLEARNRIETEAKSRLENHSLILMESLERQLKSMNRVLETMRSTVPSELAKPGGAAVLTREFVTLTQAQEGVRTLALLDAGGTIVACNRPEVIGKNFAQREYFQAALQHPHVDSLYLSAPFVTILGVNSMIIAKMVPGTLGEFAGIVTAAIDSNSLADLLVSMHASSDTSLSVIHGNGQLLILNPAQASAPPGRSLLEPGSLFQRHVQSGQAASMMQGHSTATGSERIMSMRTLQTPGLHMTAPLIVGAARDLDEVLAPWREQARTRALAFLLMVLGTTMALLFYQRRQLAFDRQIQQKEQDRQRSLRVLQGFIDQLPGTAYVKDANSKTLMANQGFHTLLGLDPISMIGKTSQELFPGDFGRKILEDDRQVLESGNTVVIEEHFNGRDYESTKFVIHDGSGQRQLGGMTTDITHRKQVERDLATQINQLRELNDKLQTAEEGLRRLSTAVEQSPASIVITDLKATIIFVNEAFTKASGYTAQEVMGQNPRILHSGETPPATYQDMWPSLVAGGVWRGEFINRRKDGSHYLELATISPVRDSSGQVTHYVAVKEDITERRRNEVELQQHREHLEQLVELRTQELAVAKEKADTANRAKSEFLANMSHEIRTPMNVIIGLNYLLRQGPTSPDQGDKLLKISEAAEHLLKIINDILDLSKIESGKLVLEHHAFSPAEVMQSVGVLIRDQAVGKGLRLEMDGDSLPRLVFGDMTRLRQVLLNFTSNALKFTEQGCITLQGEQLSREGNEVTCRFTVADTGIGIEPGDTARLFNAFEQLDGTTTRRFGGTGLGLAIARHLAHLMGGEVGVDSVPGQGSRFWLTLRLALASETASPQPTDWDTSANKTRLTGRVLLVEDDPLSCEVSSQLLRAVGLEVAVADNGQMALQSFQETNFDLVLMDIQMPVMDGIAASRQIRATAKGATVPIVALSANVFASDQEKCLQAGMNDFLPKPVVPEALYAMLSHYLAPAVQAVTNHPLPSSPSDHASGSIEDLAQQIRQLETLLRSGNVQAGEHFQRLQTELKRAFPAECEQLRQQIKLYHFDAALATLASLPMP